ncbi:MULTISPECIES: hypothetical protein [Thiorhodovibrio]|uniref:hypothetical protein n=1 Tax=Thiorhodovibrio TaxID=61593 RepID=UPI001913A4D6|nr:MULTISPECIES: hypothetical protein [Thiorhodovibrio]WPL12937.1 hypothetical protein Thiosp_02722 [Thiorhodovibrio litoralis]
MTPRSTVTNAVYQASCPGSRTPDSEFNFNRAQGTQGAWSWDGASAITRFPDLGVHIAVIFLPDASCDEALFAVEAGQKLPSLGFKIDRRNFGYVEPEVSQFEDRFVSGFPLSKSGLAALKHGYKLILESNLGTLRVSLRGSSASFTQAYNNCMAIHSGDTVANSATDVALADVLKPLEGWWALNNVFNCADVDGDSRIFIGRIAWDNSGRPYISEGERFRVAFHEGNCVFTSAKQQGNKIKLESRCAQEDEKYSGVTRLKILSPNLLNIQIANWGGFSQLFRCPDE